VSLADVNGNTLPGYPQNWYLSGASLDVSNIIPLTFPPSVRFGMPVLQNPSSTQPQSIASPIAMNGYNVQGSGNVGPALFSSYTSGTLPAPTATLAQWTPNVGVTVKRISAFAQTAGSGGSTGTSFQVTDGTNTCTVAGLLPAAGTFSSSNSTSGICNFSAGVGLSLKDTADDHASRPQNVTVTVEMTAQ
jgi:hypothetical protein